MDRARSIKWIELSGYTKRFKLYDRTIQAGPVTIDKEGCYKPDADRSISTA